MSAPFTQAQLAEFINGTLEDASLIDAIEAAINADPVLAARVEALAANSDLAVLVRDAFAPVISAPVPDRLIKVVTSGASSSGESGGAVVDFAAVLAARKAPPAHANDAGGAWRWPQLGAIAASLVIGVMIGGSLLSGAGPDSSAGGGLVLASADLDTMLDSVPSGKKVDLANLGTGEVVLTFRNIEGRLCRQFVLEGSDGTSDALACADGAGTGRWQIEAYGRRAAPVGEMKLAGGDAAPAVVAAVDAMIAGDPLIGADEAAELGKK